MIESAMFLVPLLIGIALLAVARQVVSERRRRRVRVLLVQDRRGKSVRIAAELPVDVGRS
ncbi:MAG: hypothetical protein JSS49_28525 [Planctomycetes bacterium]|nr:hypothetical protein [Planctomycetota bacterium]